MAMVYQAVFQYNEEEDELSLTRILPDGSQETSPVSLKEIQEIDEACRDFRWNRSADLSERIGKKLFDILNGDNQNLVRALKEADDHGERLEVYVSPDKYTANLPFELLYYSDFLVPSRVHLVRHVSDWGSKRTPHCKDHPLRILFMACSPDAVQPVLEFEKEEDAVFEITEDLPAEIDVEDTGSLEGLAECLAQNEYDVVHLSGHADIDKQGVPLFCMEDEEGLPVWVTAQRLSEKLNLNLPRLLFLSGCRTGEAPLHAAAASFAYHLTANHCSTCLGWGLPVSDPGATSAARQLYFELSRGKNVLEAVLTTRQGLFKHHQTDWSLLRLFSDGTPMNVSLVQSGQKRRAKLRDLQHIYLYHSQVKVLKKGFVGRRKHIQRGLRCLKKDEKKIGLLLHGTGGLGKSCLAGKFCERLKNHTLIIVHGKLNAVTFGEALKDGFVRGKDKEGLRTLQESTELSDKLRNLCSSSFQENHYLILLDDFEKNLVKMEEDQPEVSSEAVSILETLLKYLPYSGKMSQLIITSRYTFPLTIEGLNLVGQRLESTGLTSFRGSDEWKKVSELGHIANYPNPDIRQQLIAAGRGNPQLMEALDTLIAEAKNLDFVSLLSAVKDKQEEFVQNLILRQILKTRSEEFQTFMRRSAVYRLPVLREGIQLVCPELKDWELYVNEAVRLSLMEQDSTRKKLVQYWVTPLLSKDIFGEQGEKERKRCHRAAVSYYQAVLSKTSEYAPMIAFELIEHALKAEMDEVAIEKEGELLAYLRNAFAYREALSHGEYILSQISEPRRDVKLTKFLFELGSLYHDIGDAKKAIESYEEVLSIDKELYGNRHPGVAIILSSLGLAWSALGDLKKAIKYGEEALSINNETYGQKHIEVAICLSNLGGAWLARGDSKKAIAYYEEALSIAKELYGQKHPDVVVYLTNLGNVWRVCGNEQKAIKYGEEALLIAKELYGQKHPDVAGCLHNLGCAWKVFGDEKKASECLREAYRVFREFYGEEHPSTKIAKKWLNSLRNKEE